MFIINESKISLKENQLYIAYLANLVLLLISIFDIWLFKNYYSSPYDPMGATPFTVDVKPQTIGEVEIFSSLTHYLWLFK